MQPLDYEPDPKHQPRRRATPLLHMTDLPRAQLVANLLERAGIPCQIFNQNAPGIGLNIPVEIQVRPEDREHAEEILRDFAEGRITVADEERDAEPDDDPRCPSCGSWQVREKQSLREDFLRLLHLRPRPEQGVIQMECLRCGHQWTTILR